jgi:Retinoblastoma-associated protein A domain
VFAALFLGFTLGSVAPTMVSQMLNACLLLADRVLEHVLRYEERQGGPRDFSQLLSSTDFQRCLLAMTLELVAGSYQILTMQFPKVWQATWCAMLYGMCNH